VQTITFYSYKGGVGRSLVVANVAKYLSSFGKKVFVIDFDLEAPGLHYKFLKIDPNKSFEKSYELLHEKLDMGIVDYIYSAAFAPTQEVLKVPESLEKFVIEIEDDSPDATGTIHLMPAGKEFTPDYWSKLAEIDWHQLFYSEDEEEQEGVPLFLHLKAQIAKEYEPDFLLIDSRTGVTEIGGVATSLLPDKVVCLFIRNLENLVGIRQVLWGIREKKRIDSPNPIEAFPVLTRIPYTEDKDYEKDTIVEPVIEFLNIKPPDRNSLEVTELVILHSEPDLEIHEALRIGGNKAPEESILHQDYLKLCSKIISKEIIEPYLEPLLEIIVASKKLSSDESDLLASNGDYQEALLKLFSLRHQRSEMIMELAYNFRKDLPKDIEVLFKHEQKPNVYSIEKISEWERNYPNLKEFWVVLPRFLGAEDPRFEKVMIHNFEKNNTKYVYFLHKKDDLQRLKALAKRLQSKVSMDIKDDIRVVLVKDVFLKQILNFTNYWIANPYDRSGTKNLQGFEVLFKDEVPVGGAPMRRDLIDELVEVIHSLEKVDKIVGKSVFALR
jgi:MinD-like ATPase involved in chromosome partitioning or flagellar assembly